MPKLWLIGLVGQFWVRPLVEVEDVIDKLPMTFGTVISVVVLIVRVIHVTAVREDEENADGDKD